MSDSPFSTEELDSVSAWELPKIGSSHEIGDQHSPSALTADEIEAIQKQAYDEAFKEGLKEGREEGLRAGLQKGQAEISQKATQLDSILSLLNQPLKELDQRIEEELVALAMLVARQLVRRELKIDPGQVIAVVRDAISTLPVTTQKISLRLHPEDAELVRSAFAQEDAELIWRIVEDPLLTRGGCEVLTENSRIDATIEKRLAAVIATALGGERLADES